MWFEPYMVRAEHGFFSARTHLRIDIKNELHNNREVKSMEDKLLEELNQLLKGTHNMEMGAKALHDFDARNFILDDETEKTIAIMKDDYASIYHKLDRYRIEFEE